VNLHTGTKLGRYEIRSKIGEADFFALWKDADADIPIPIKAKKEYEQLK
jgi:hypothetical protein